MVLSLGLMLIIIFVVVGTTGLCSFNPGDPKQGKVTTVVDDATFLTMEAQQAGYPVRIPELPDGWTPNSAKRVTFEDSGKGLATSEAGSAGANGSAAGAEAGASRSAAVAPVGSSVGWVHDKNWIELVQTGVSASTAAEGWDSNARTATGSQTTTDSSGATVTWTVYTSEDDSVRRLWVADHGDVRWLITGIGGDADFTTMAKAISTAPTVSLNSTAASGVSGAATSGEAAGRSAAATPAEGGV